MDKTITLELIAPCGMNCNLCIAYLRDKNNCPGCTLMGLKNNGQSNKTYCRKCIIKNCSIIGENNWKYCSPRCKIFPCRRLKSLDKRYKTKYGMSMIANLEFIHKKGIEMFVKQEKEKWMKDGTIFCIHNKEYYKINSN